RAGERRLLWLAGRERRFVDPSRRVAPPGTGARPHRLQPLGAEEIAGKDLPPPRRTLSAGGFARRRGTGRRRRRPVVGQGARRRPEAARGGREPAVGQLGLGLVRGGGGGAQPVAAVLVEPAGLDAHAGAPARRRRRRRLLLSCPRSFARGVG